MIQMARPLLKQAAAEEGFDLPVTVTLSYREAVRGYLPQPTIVAQDIQHQLGQMGINAELNVVEFRDISRSSLHRQPGDVYARLAGRLRGRD